MRSILAITLTLSLGAVAFINAWDFPAWKRRMVKEQDFFDKVSD